MLIESIEEIKNSRLIIISYEITSEQSIYDFIINVLQPNIVISDYNTSSESLLKKLSKIQNKKVSLLIPLGVLSIPKSKLKRAKILRDFVRSAKMICDKNDNKLILINTQYITLGSNTIFMPGGETILYICDVFFQQSGNKIKCVKNRFGKNFEINLDDIKRTIRKLKINKINGEISNRN